MRTSRWSFVQRALNDRRGQVLPLVALGMVALLAAAGFTIDVGHAYVVRNQLQNTANAAALAAAGEVYNTSSTDNATSVANHYAGSTGDLNSNSTLGAVATAVTPKCLNMLMPPGTTCVKTGSSPTPPNAVQVKETASVPTFFMKILGKPTLTVVAEATASMQGVSQPWNVAIILDATSSMGDAPPAGSCTGYKTEFACALAGVQDLLAAVTPSNGKLQISIFSFPNVSTATVADDYTGGTPTYELYTLPKPSEPYATLGYGSKTPGTAPPPSTYQDVPFSSDWYSATSSTHLNSSSDLVKAVTGDMKNPGGESTYYASVIYAAQAALDAAHTSGTQDAMIILSDGQANATNAKFPATGANAWPSGDGYNVTTNSTSNTYGSKGASNLAGGTWGTYPDFHDECQQAIKAAQDAQAAGTTVYSVAFNSESDGCAVSGSGVTVTDTTLWATATSGNAALSLNTLTPCIVMKNMASPPTSTQNYFYADTSSASGGCADPNHTVQSIQDIFGAIGSTFTTPRLLPNNAT